MSEELSMLDQEIIKLDDKGNSVTNKIERNQMRTDWDSYVRPEQ